MPRVIENDFWYSFCKYLKRLMHLRYLQCLQGEDALASSSLGITRETLNPKSRSVLGSVEMR
ncbi:hypothetical protein FB480_106175 [Agrobacterium vitis]|nr:hypothetical protein FB480_106175 [Agrobacterium vitis]